MFAALLTTLALSNCRVPKTLYFPPVRVPVLELKFEKIPPVISRMLFGAAAESVPE
jgi:hypothetical protein